MTTDQVNASSGSPEKQPHFVQTPLSQLQEPHRHLHIAQKPSPDLSKEEILEIIASLMLQIRYPDQLNVSCKIEERKSCASLTE